MPGKLLEFVSNKGHISIIIVILFILSWMYTKINGIQDVNDTQNNRLTTIEVTDNNRLPGIVLEQRLTKLETQQSVIIQRLTEINQTLRDWSSND